MSRRWPANGLVLAVLWLFVRGMELTPVRVAEEFLIGLALGMPLAFATRRFYDRTLPLRRNLRVAPYAVLYVLIFLKDLIVANFAVARIVLSPGLPIEPRVVEVPLRVRSDPAITTIANSITLTPGTLTMDYDADRNSLYVHGIAAPTRESIVDPIRVWEEYALAIFDEELKPGDPVPEPDIVEEGTAAFGGDDDE